METFISDLSKKEFPKSEKISAQTIRPSVLAVIKKEYPEFSADKSCSLTELNIYRQHYISEYLVNEVGELSELEDTVLDSLKNRNTLVDKIEDVNTSATIGQRLADRVATFGGSWTFILSFTSFLLIWIALNVFFLSAKPFDPYPFILLNLLLSTLAALQAPIIMMSQNRQEEKDRDRAKKDYMINLKSELEIRMLHEKIDHLIIHQQHELIEIQKVQIDMMNDIAKKIK
ncbi:DUF1003 domain-containing protein [Leptospira alexanderi]|uniref:PF06210 family protein n=1 Tax=Leptospira alexanderi serovar Manhao 3 str. L 60 TaxID=1049759 RepID=V6HX95_9LEPT|nr:DUF1003 domain-containing protein [Leptospira alexanderi]EQA62570.1 PF06210 family protein [Leptospira alexanderi serovar Manhao 3 str. L 60]